MPGRTPRTESKISRRALLVGAVSGVGAALHAGQRPEAPRPEAPRPAAPVDSTKLQGQPPSELGQRSRFERPRRVVRRPGAAGASESPLQDLSGILTPADLHFERHHGGVPEIDPERYRLLIHGLVERPTVFTLSDLKRLPSQSRTCFIECSGNGGRGFLDIAAEISPQGLDGLTSCSEWTGVALATLFQEVGVRAGAAWFLAEGQDAAVMSRSIPVAKGWDDALLAYGQNGEPLRPGQGYPVRLLLPGFEGNACVKWLRRIELSDQPFMTREETSKYSDPLANCTARIFSFEMDAKSIITFPAYPAKLAARGWLEIKGIAWSGRGKIARVEVSTDGGRSWQDAELQQPVLSKCHTRFRLMWNWGGREALLMSRATDETGYVQPTLQALRAARGAGTHYHFNNVRAWQVRRDGELRFANKA